MKRPHACRPLLTALEDRTMLSTVNPFQTIETSVLNDLALEQRPERYPGCRYPAYEFPAGQGAFRPFHPPAELGGGEPNR